MRKAGNSFLELHYSAARAIAQLQQQALQQELINYIVQAMRGTLVLSEVLQDVINGLHVALDLSSCLIFRPDADQQMTVDYVSTQTTNREHLCSIYPGHHYHHQLTLGESVVLPLIDTIPQIGICSLLIVPMLYRENYIGAIGLHQDDERQWQTEEITLIEEVASYCTLAMVQASLSEQLQAQKSPEVVQPKLHPVLSESEFKFRAIIENSIYMISLKDLEGRYLLINPAGVKILGRPAEEILGKRDADLFTNQTGDQIWQTDQQVMQKRITRTYEETAESGGYRRTFQSTKFPYLSSNGELLGIISICRDITANKQVEETLRMFDRAVAASSNGIVIVDARMPDLPMIYINPAFERITGYTRAEVVGENCRFLHGVDTEQSELNKLRLAIREQRSCTVTLRNYRKDGTLFWNELSVSPIRNSEEILTHYVGIQKDITSRKVAEEELQQAKDQLQAVLDAVPGLVSWINSDLRYMGVNHHLAAAFNKLPEDFVGKEINFLQVNSKFPKFITQFFASRESQSSQEVKIEVAGEQRSYLVVAQKYHLLKAAVLVGIDITDRQRMEEELRATTSRLTTLIQNLQAGILVENEFRQIALANQEFCTMFQITSPPEALIGLDHSCSTNLEKNFFLEPEKFGQRIAQILAKRQVVTNEELQLEDGRTFERDYVPIFVSGNYSGHLWMYRDITKRKGIETEIRKALEKEKELGELKSRFVSMTSHEFRTPLTTILSSSELLEHYRHKWADEKQLTHLHRIQNAVVHMTQMLNDVLIIGKAEVGKLDFNPVPLDLAEFCHYLVEEMQLNAQTLHAIAFNSPHQSIPSCMDEKLLRHIFFNLLSNAIKYSATNSTIQFHLDCQDNQAVLKIQDQGIGIPDADLPRLFESFHRATNVGNIPGTGLGLSIVKKCLDIHQGEITVESELGVGTTFIVKLPINSQVRQEADHEQNSGD